MERINPYLKLFVIVIVFLPLTTIIPGYSWDLIQVFREIGSGARIGKEVGGFLLTLLFVAWISRSLSESLFSKKWKKDITTLYLVFVFVFAFVNTIINLVEGVDLTVYLSVPMLVVFMALLIKEYSEVTGKSSRTTAAERERLDHNPSVIWGQER